MGSRNRSGLFLPDERGIGGAMEIAEEYKHFYTKCRTGQSPGRCSGAEPPSAQQLSYQRQAKHFTSNTVAHDHLVRLGHMYKRIAAPLPSSSGQQASWLPEHRPRPGSVAADMCLWLPKRHTSPQIRRPSTAPEQRSSRSSRSHALQQDAGSSDSRQPPPDWQQLKAAAHPQPQPSLQPVQLPPSRYYLGPNLLPSVQHRLYKAAIMGDILTRQLYKAAEIRQLCVAFVASNPPEHRDLLRQVAAEVLHDLEIPYTSELDSV